MEININGDIIPNDDKWIYDWLEWDGTCPNDIRQALQNKTEGEILTVNINSGGGSVWAGEEIYSLLAGRNDVEIIIQSLAGSAASYIAMANRCKISPIGMLMIHNVSTSGASGDYREMQKNADTLLNINKAIAKAYELKTGKSQEEILRMMDAETWIAADRALEEGFVDEIVENKQPQYANSAFEMRLTDEIRQKVLAEKAEKDRIEAEKKEILEDLYMY